MHTDTLASLLFQQMGVYSQFINMFGISRLSQTGKIVKRRKNNIINCCWSALDKGKSEGSDCASIVFVFNFLLRSIMHGLASGIDLWFHVLGLEWSGYQIMNVATQWLMVCSKMSSSRHSLGTFGHIWIKVTHICGKNQTCESLFVKLTHWPCWGLQMMGILEVATY